MSEFLEITYSAVITSDFDITCQSAAKTELSSSLTSFSVATPCFVSRRPHFPPHAIPINHLESSFESARLALVARKKQFFVLGMRALPRHGLAAHPYHGFDERVPSLS